MDVIAVTSLLPPLYVLFGGPASEEGVNLKDKQCGLFNPIPNDILRSDLVLPV